MNINFEFFNGGLSYQTLVDNQVKSSPNEGLESLLSSMGAGGEEEVMAKMMKELEGLMETGDFENMFSGMMEQLVSRDLLYEPLNDLSLKVFYTAFVKCLLFFLVSCLVGK